MATGETPKSIGAGNRRPRNTCTARKCRCDIGNEVMMDNKYKSVPVKSSEITPYSIYLSRRDFLKAAGIVSGSALLAACTPKGTSISMPQGGAALPVEKDELGDPTNSFEDITHYNNFYEFTEDKQGVAGLAE